MGGPTSHNIINIVMLNRCADGPAPASKPTKRRLPNEGPYEALRATCSGELLHATRSSVLPQPVHEDSAPLSFRLTR
jgi:hypothetical protein